MFGLGYVVAIATLLSLSFGDTIGKNVSTKFGNYVSTLFIMGFGIIPLLVSLLFFPQNLFNYNGIVLAVVAGFFLALGYVLVYKSLETEQASNTWVLLNISAAMVVLFGVFALRESVDLVQVISIVLVFMGVILVTVTREFKFNRLLLPAIVGNVSWVVFLILIVYGISGTASESTGLFLISRVAGFLMLLTYLLFTRKINSGFMAKLRRPNLAAISSGLFDGFAQVTYTLVVLLQFVVIGASMTALEPAIVTMLSIAAYKEKLTKIQLVGLIISVFGAVALGLF
jgi:drug/metabolite transporter (DMT)-like permease